MERTEQAAAARPSDPRQAANGNGDAFGSRGGAHSDAHAADPLTAPSVLSRAAIGLLVLYKRWISPLLPGACRFTPTCSEYAQMAVIRYGLWRGGLRAIGRIVRCHPFHPGGVDLP